jgi:hypothetical protein
VDLTPRTFLTSVLKGEENCGQRPYSSLPSNEAVTLRLVAEWLSLSASLEWPFVLMERGIPNFTHKIYLHVTYIATHICIHYDNFCFTKIVVLLYIILLVKKFVPKYILCNR